MIQNNDLASFFFKFALLDPLFNLWDFQLNTEMAQQTHEDQPSFDLVKILNVTSEDGEESSLNISLEEVLAAGAVEETAVGDEEIGRVSGS